MDNQNNQDNGPESTISNNPVQNNQNPSFQQPSNHNESYQNPNYQNLSNQNLSSTYPNNQDANYQNLNQQSSYLLNSIIDSLSGWMKFMGIITIISGSLTCLGIITAAIGVPMIFAGIALTKGSTSIKSYKQFNNQVILNDVFSNLNKYFKIKGILAIVIISIYIVYFLFLIIVFALSFSTGYPYY